MATVYHYHPDTKEFLGQSAAKPDPKEAGRFLLPANSTNTPAPASVPAGFAAVWDQDGGVWNQTADHRGKTFYDGDGNPVEIEDLGEPVGLTPTKPPVVVSRADVNFERDRRIHAGFVFNGKRFDFDPASKDRVTGAATLAKFAVLAGAQPGELRWVNPNADFSWIAQDNTLVSMDAQTCSAFGDAAAVHEQTHIFAARALKNMATIPTDYASDSYWP